MTAWQGRQPDWVKVRKTFRPVKSWRETLVACGIGKREPGGLDPGFQAIAIDLAGRGGLELLEAPAQDCVVAQRPQEQEAQAENDQPQGDL
jgi:hypothetical protein